MLLFFFNKKVDTRKKNKKHAKFKKIYSCDYSLLIVIYLSKVFFFLGLEIRSSTNLALPLLNSVVVKQNFFLVF